MERDPLSQPMLSRDACSMLRKESPFNQPPLEAKFCALHNDRVDAWEEVVKSLYGDKIDPMKVSFSWTSFCSSVEMPHNAEAVKHLPRMSDEQVAYWKAFFERGDPTEMHDAGAEFVRIAWNMLSTERMIRLMEARWKAVYTRFEDPAEQEKELAKRPELYSQSYEGPDVLGWTPVDLRKILITTRALFTSTNPMGS